MEHAESKIERALFLTGMAAVLALAVLQFLSAVADDISRKKVVPIVVLSDPPALLSYHPDSLKVDIVHLPENAVPNLTGSNLQKAHAVESFFMPEISSANPVWYIVPPKSALAGEISLWDSSREWIKNWRTEPALVLKYAALLGELARQELTNLPLYELAFLALELPRLDISDFRIAMVPGKRRGRKFISDEEESAILARSVGISAPAAATSEEQKTVTAEVYNATGRPRVALEATKFLRTKGIDVVFFGNHPETESASRIIDRSGRISASETVRHLLDLDSLEIHSELDKSRYADVTVILGADFALPVE